MEHIPGINKGDIRLYIGNNCTWSQQTRQLLDSLGVEYDVAVITDLEYDEFQEAMGQISKWSPELSVPVLVLNNERGFVGFQEAEIKQALE